MHSLNPAWSPDSFHARVASLAEIPANGRVLDLGCGRGLTLPYLLSRSGPSGEVVAADRNRRSLDAIGIKFPEEIANGRLTLTNLNIADKLPFEPARFDSVICQNVIECIADKSALIADIARVLRPGGVAVIGHHDFDGVLLASDDRDLTRRMVHGYADYTQQWQEFSDGQMGRLLPGLVAASPLSTGVTETVMFVDRTLSENSYARQHLEGMVSLAQEFGIADDVAKAWLRRLEARADAEQFYYALPWMYVVSRLPPA